MLPSSRVVVTRGTREAMVGVRGLIRRDLRLLRRQRERPRPAVHVRTEPRVLNLFIAWCPGCTVAIALRPKAQSPLQLPQPDGDAGRLAVAKNRAVVALSERPEFGAAKTLAAAVEAAFLVDLAEWRRWLWARAANHAEAPLDGPVHKALTQVDREACVPASERALAACDMPIPITENMTESAPHAVAVTLAAVCPSNTVDLGDDGSSPYQGSRIWAPTHSAPKDEGGCTHTAAYFDLQLPTHPPLKEWKLAPPRGIEPRFED